jgi:hypothetical protein
VIVFPASGALPWILPPACGAIVGAATGWLVGSRLVLGRAVPSLLSSGIDDLTRWALALPADEIAPRAGSPAAASLENAVAGALGGVLGSRSFIYAVRDLASQVVTGLASRKVSDIAAEIGLAGFLEEKVLPSLAVEPRRAALARTAGTLLAEQAGAALGDEVLRELSGVFELYVPEAVEAVVHWLRSPDTRATLSERGRELVPRILEKLSELQKLFISAGQFDRRLNEKMPEIVADTIAAAEKMLRDPLQQRKLVEAFFESTKGWRDSLLVTRPDTARPWNDARQKVADSTSTIARRFMERLEDPGTRHSIARQAEQSFLEDRRTLGMFAREVFGIRDTEIVELLSSRVLASLVQPHTAQTIAKRLCGVLFSFVEENSQVSIGTVLKIDPDRKRILDQALRARVPRIVEELVPLISRARVGGLRLAGLSALVGAGMGLLIGVLVGLLKLLGYQ